jgi:8-oxo-dGTP pyrophosphatase MutT (NUDIX family)
MKGWNSGSMRASSTPARTPQMTWLAHSSVATIVEKDGLFLMVEETDEGRTVFNQPAGHLEEHETLFEAAVRETLEETGWHVELTDFLGLYHYPAPNGVTYIRHCFVARPLRHDSNRALDTGILAAHWLSMETILAPHFRARSPIVGRVIRDYLSGTRYPLSLIYHHGSLQGTVRDTGR